MKRKEIIVTIILLTAALITLLIFRNVNKEKIMIQVKDQYGEILLSTPLDTDGYYEIQGKNGIFHLEVKDGRYRAHDVDCPNHDCEQTGWVYPEDYRPIICLPNGIIVELGK